MFKVLLQLEGNKGALAECYFARIPLAGEEVTYCKKKLLIKKVILSGLTKTEFDYYLENDEETDAVASMISYVATCIYEEIGVVK